MGSANAHACDGRLKQEKVARRVGGPWVGPTGRRKDYHRPQLELPHSIR